MLIGSQPQPLIVQGEPGIIAIVPVAFRRHIGRVSIIILMPAELEPNQENCSRDLCWVQQTAAGQQEESSLAAGGGRRGDG